MSYIDRIVIGWHKNSNDTNGNLTLTNLSDDTQLVDWEAVGQAVVDAIDSVTGIDTVGGTVYTVTDTVL